MQDVDTAGRDGAEWAARLDRGPLGAGDQIRLDAWLAADAGRCGELLRARAALAFVGPDRAATAIPSRSAFSRPSVAAWWVAAAMALLVIGIGWSFRGTPGTAIQTAVGEMRKMPLSDGSAVTVNTESALAIRMEADRRTIRLERGEVLFEVAKDAGRPFVVTSENVNIQAIGTVFSVRRRESGIEVQVVEGVVETWVDGVRGLHRRVGAGERAFISTRTSDIAVSAIAPSALAWRDGTLEFDETPLAAAVEEINRYNSRKIILDDPELGQQTLVGSFRANEPAHFAEAVRKIFGARVSSTGTTIRISPPTR